MSYYSNMEIELIESGMTRKQAAKRIEWDSKCGIAQSVREKMQNERDKAAIQIAKEKKAALFAEFDKLPAKCTCKDIWDAAENAGIPFSMYLYELRDEYKQLQEA